MPGFAAKVTAARLVVEVAVAASNSNYWAFQLKNKGTAGTGTTNVLDAGDANKTKSTGGINSGAGLAANAVGTFTLHGTSSNRDVSAGQILVFEIDAALNPSDLVDAVVELDLEATA